MKNKVNALTSSNTEPMVSVVIPAFNASHTVGEALTSVVEQTWENFEIVVCDDASSDNTVAVINTITDSRIEVLQNTSNLGEGGTRDRAIEAAKGDWIAFLDADDTWHPHRLEVLLSTIHQRERDVIIFDDVLVCHQTENGMRPWKALRGPKAFGARDGMAIDVSPSTWARSRRFIMQPLIPAACFKSLGTRHSNLHFGADTEFLLRLVAAGMKLRYVPQALYNYRLTPGSMSTTKSRAMLMRDMLVNILPLFEGDPAMQAALQRKIDYRDFTMAIKSGDLASAVKQAIRQPSLATELAARGAAEVPYHLHRMWHRVENRKMRDDDHA